VEKAVSLLEGAQRPALLAGASVYWDAAWEPLRALAEKLQIPVYLNGAGRGCLPREHALLFQHTRKDALAQADVALVVGTPFDFRLGYGEGVAPQGKVVQVDIDPAEIGRNRGADVGIVADSHSALVALEAAAAPRRHEGYVAELRAMERARAEAIAEWSRSDATPVHHYRLARELAEVSQADGADPTYVCDGGNWVAMAAKVITPSRPGRWLDPGPLGCLGVGAPFAIAARLLDPARPVWIIQGDGSFGLNGMDFETALRFRLPMVCVVGNDAAWGQIRLPQVQMFGEEKSPATRLAPTRYDRIVEAMGGYGENVVDPGAIRPALERARASGTVACVNVMLDPEAPLKAGAMGYAV